MAGLAEGGPRVQTACALTWQDTVGPGGRDGIRLLRGGAETGSRGWSRGAARPQAEGEDVGGKATAHPEPRHRAGRPERGRGPPLRSRPWVRQRPKNQASREPSVACSPQGAPFGSSVTHGPAMAAGRTRSGQPAPHSQPCPPQDSGRAGGAGGSSGLPPIPASQRRCSPTPCTAWAALRVTAPVLRAKACSPRTGARRSGSDLLALPRLASAAHSSGPRPDLAQVTQA